VAPVNITAHRDESVERESHAAIIWASNSLFTILNFAWLVIVIVLMLLPGSIRELSMQSWAWSLHHCPSDLWHGSNYAEAAKDLVAGKVVHCLSPCI